MEKIIIFSLLFFFLLFFFPACDKDDCWICSNGRCYKCNGKGYDNIEAEICKVCKGDGICFNCHGTGRIKSK